MKQIDVAGRAHSLVIGLGLTMLLYTVWGAGGLLSQVRSRVDGRADRKGTTAEGGRPGDNMNHGRREANQTQKKKNVPQPGRWGKAASAPASTRALTMVDRGVLLVPVQPNPATGRRGRGWGVPCRPLYPTGRMQRAWAGGGEYMSRTQAGTSTSGPFAASATPTPERFQKSRAYLTDVPGTDVGASSSVLQVHVGGDESERGGERVGE
jgi:hypothetical protein